MKITEYPSASEILPGHKFLVDGPDGTQTVSGSLVLENAGSGEGGGTGHLTSDPYIVHRNTYRGANLGDTYTDAQKEAVSSGSFEDIYVGDYWEINGIKWRVMDIDYFYDENDTHHLVIMPDTYLGGARYHSGNINTVGYYNSEIRTSILRASSSDIVSNINNIFGANRIFTYKDALTSAINSTNHANAVTYADAFIELPSMAMLFGTNGAGAANGWLNGAAAHKQFSACAFNPSITNIKATYWLRETLNVEKAFILNDCDYFEGSLATVSNKIRPVFAIK